MSSTDLKIVNGVDANYLKYPFFASLQFKGSNVPFCGGSYIGGRYRTVITAAHCVKGLKPNQIQAVFRKSSISAKGLKYNIKRIRIHPKYNNNTLDYDIALLYLSKKPSKKVKRIRVPNNKLGRRFIKPGNRVYIIGFGRIKYQGSFPKKLQFANIKIISKSNKTDNKYPSSWITNRMILASDYRNISNPNDNRDSCNGDSGGPLFDAYKKRWYLIGLTSWGIGCAFTGYPGVYTNLNSLRGWIKKYARV